MVALVEGRGRVPAYRDAALGDRLQSLARATPGVRSVTLTPATGADGCLQLHLAPAADPGQVTGAVAERLRADPAFAAAAVRGLRVTVAPVLS